MLALLLFVPIVVSGHAHGRAGDLHTCSMCVAVHHSPSLSSAQVPWEPDSPIEKLEKTLDAETPAARLDASSNACRAPPLAVPRRLV